MKTLFEIYKSLEETKIEKEKRDIIKDNWNNPLFKEFMNIVYNPNINLGIANIKIPKDSSSGILEDYILIIKERLTTDLANGSNQALEFLDSIMKTLNKDNQILLQKMIRKNLGIGIGIKNLNKAVPNAIFTPPYMRCSLLNEKTKSKIKFPAIIQTKYDGMFVNLIFKNKEVKFMSRSGTYYNFDKILDFSNLYDYVTKEFGECVILGEMLVRDENNNICPREVGNGIINKGSLSNNSITKEEVERIFVTPWDILSIEEFENRFSDIPYYQRLMKVGSLNNPFFVKVKTKIVNSFQEAYDFYEERLKENEEGAIIKDKDLRFEDKTSSYQLKIKCKFQVELEIVEIKNGKSGTKLENTLGSIFCVSKDRKLKVDVGSGFTEKERDIIYKNKEKYIGKIVTIEAHRISEKEENISLILPVFIEVREDKTEADTFERIKEQENSARFI